MSETKMIANPLKNWPEREVCFCGSGQAFKKCHKDLLTDMVPDDERVVAINKMIESLKDKAAIERQKVLLLRR